MEAIKQANEILKNNDTELMKHVERVARAIHRIGNESNADYIWDNYKGINPVTGKTLWIKRAKAAISAMQPTEVSLLAHLMDKHIPVSQNEGLVKEIEEHLRTADKFNNYDTAEALLEKCKAALTSQPVSQPEPINIHSDIAPEMITKDYAKCLDILGMKGSGKWLSDIIKPVSGGKKEEE